MVAKNPKLLLVFKICFIENKKTRLNHTKDNYTSYRVVPLNSMLCSGGWRKEGYINDFVGIIWPHVLRWFGICIVLLYDIRMHVLQFGCSHLFRKGHSPLHSNDLVDMYFDYLK